MNDGYYIAKDGKILEGPFRFEIDAMRYATSVGLPHRPDRSRPLDTTGYYPPILTDGYAIQSG